MGLTGQLPRVQSKAQTVSFLCTHVLAMLTLRQPPHPFPVLISHGLLHDAFLHTKHCAGVHQQEAPPAAKEQFGSKFLTDDDSKCKQYIRVAHIFWELPF